jgi:hypothetical protein
MTSFIELMEAPAHPNQQGTLVTINPAHIWKVYPTLGAPLGQMRSSTIEFINGHSIQVLLEYDSLTSVLEVRRWT